MKKIFFYVFIILSLVIFSCSGCNNGENDDIENTLVPSMMVSDIENTPEPSLIAADIVKEMNIYGFNIEKETEAPGFTKLIYDRYGFEIKFPTIGVRSYNTEIISNLDGLLLISSVNLLDGLRDKTEKYYTLNDFLKDNEVFNLLPEQYRKSLEDENGDIWSFPTSQNLRISRRIYNETIMDDNDLSTPETVGELIELLKTVKEMYSDDEDFTILKITPEECLWQLKDILEYCGLIVNDYSRRGIISWNEETQRFEDTIYNLDADLLFDIIDYMSMNSLYSIEDSNSDAAIWNGKAFTEIQSTSQNYKYMSEPFYKHKEYIYNKTLNNLFVPLGTPNPKETINLFINTFFGSNEGNIYGTYGESGRGVIYDDSFTQVTILEYDKQIANEDGSYYSINLVSSGLNNDYVVYINSHDAELNEKNIRQKSEYKNMLLEKLNTDEIEVLALYKNLSIGGIKSDLTTYSDDEIIFRNMFYKYLTDGIGRETFVEKYIKRMKETDIGDYINDKNEIVNADSMFYYD